MAHRLKVGEPEVEAGGFRGERRENISLDTC